MTIKNAGFTSRKTLITSGIVVLLIMAVGIAGCDELSGLTNDEEAVHVTAICEVTVIDQDGNPVPGVAVSFNSMKFTGTSPQDGSEFNLKQSTDGDGKASFTVGYNLRERNIGFPVQDAISMTASIPGPIDGGAIIGYQEAYGQAGGTGAAVITKTITLQIPYGVK